MRMLQISPGKSHPSHLLWLTYCNQACQRAHWKSSHKAACKACLLGLVNSYRVGAEEGDAVAQMDLGWCYATGHGVPRMTRKQCSGTAGRQLLGALVDKTT